MANNFLHYDQLIEEAYRGVIRRVLAGVLADGLPGSHHFFIAFKTSAPGVEMADFLRERWPDEMTIVLQYQYWNLEVETDWFSVTLSFNDVPERLVIPYSAIVSFADPAAKFGLQFKQETGAAPEPAPRPTPVPAATPPASILSAKAKPKAPKLASVPKAVEPDEADAASEDEADAKPADKVITLDSFRRK